MTMKKILNTALTVSIMLSLVSCYDNLDEPDTSDYATQLQAGYDLPEPNITISELKQTYCSNKGKVERPDPWTNDSVHFSRNTSNWETRIQKDLVIEGVICANDGQFGALYQTLLVRNIDSTATPATDQAIMVRVKHTCLYPFYPVGQRIRLNLNGLYVGAYSRVPEIGYPYWTSNGNHNLGPIPFEIFTQHIQLIGQPDATLAECKEIDRTGSEGDAWLRASDNRIVANFPTIVTVQGTFPEADGVAVLAPDSLEDAGYAVDRTLKLLSNNTTLLVRTSTGNELSHFVMPVGKTVQLSGLLQYSSYDDKWQINLRDTSDFKILK